MSATRRSPVAAPSSLLPARCARRCWRCCPTIALTAAQRARDACLTLAAPRLLAARAHPAAAGPYLLVDDLNIVFIVLNTFVGFTTSVFSASYIAHELETGRLTPTYLRFYHAMYQVLMFG